MSPLILSILEGASQGLIESIRARLGVFCRNPPTHARFLNTLSLMEHIGSRKIMASQTTACFDLEMLKHMAEEARHAYFFKRAAEKLAGRSLSYAAADTLAGASAKAYMGRLDCEITRATARTGALAYVYMSLMVERRAVWLYRLYQNILEECRISITLKSVLAEEDLHLERMLARARDRDRAADLSIERFARLEDARFRSLWDAIVAEGESQAPQARGGTALERPGRSIVHS